MSIATLKKKAFATQVCHSTKDGFSLNGVYRQPTSNLGRSVTRTPMKGPVAKGYGEGSRCRVSGWRARECGSSYPIHIIQSNSITDTKIKRSTMNMHGLLETMLKGPHYNHAYRVDKTQGGYIDTTVRKSVCNTQPYVVLQGSCTPYTKNEDIPTYGEYIRIKTRHCV